MSKIKFNFDMSGKDKEEEAFKKQMAQLYAFQAMAQGQNPMEAYRGVMDYKPTPPPAEAIQSADPAQQMQNFTQRSGQPQIQPSPFQAPQRLSSQQVMSDGLTPRQIDPIASAGLKADALTDKLRERQVFDPMDLAQEQRKAEIQTGKEIASQEGKQAAVAERDYLRVSSTIDTNLQQFYNFASEQTEKLGVQAGDFFGIIDKLTPRQFNEAKEAFESSSKEGSATIARALIPNMRAIQGAVMFKGSTANIGSTLSGSINNTAGTQGNAFGSALSNNIVDIDEQGNRIPIQDIAIDKKTGKLLSQLPVVSDGRTRADAINDLKNEFVKRWTIDKYMQAYMINPKIFKPSDMRKFEALIPSKFKFKTTTEANKANVPQGALVFIGGKPYYKE
jgi:hypothetical protein